MEEDNYVERAVSPGSPQTPEWRPPNILEPLYTSRRMSEAGGDEEDIVDRVIRMSEEHRQDLRAKDEEHRQDLRAKDEVISRKDEEHRQDLRAKDEEHRQDLKEHKQDLNKHKQELRKKDKVISNLRLIWNAEGIEHLVQLFSKFRVAQIIAYIDENCKNNENLCNYLFNENEQVVKITSIVLPKYLEVYDKRNKLNDKLLLLVSESQLFANHSESKRSTHPGGTRNEGTKSLVWTYEQENLKRISSGYTLADNMRKYDKPRIGRLAELIAPIISFPEKFKEHYTSKLTSSIFEILCDFINNTYEELNLKYYEQFGEKPTHGRIITYDAVIKHISKTIITIEFKSLFGIDLKTIHTIHLLTILPNWFLAILDQVFYYMMVNGSSHAIITDGILFFPIRLLVDDFWNNKNKYSPSKIPPHEFDIHYINERRFVWAMLNWILEAKKCGSNPHMSDMEEFYCTKEPQGNKRQRIQ